MATIDKLRPEEMFLLETFRVSLQKEFDKRKINLNDYLMRAFAMQRQAYTLSFKNGNFKFIYLIRICQENNINFCELVENAMQQSFGENILPEVSEPASNEYQFNQRLKFLEKQVAKIKPLEKRVADLEAELRLYKK